MLILCLALMMTYIEQERKVPQIGLYRKWRQDPEYAGRVPAELASSGPGADYTPGTLPPGHQI